MHYQYKPVITHVCMRGTGTNETVQMLDKERTNTTPHSNRKFFASMSYFVITTIKGAITIGAAAAVYLPPCCTERTPLR